MIVLYTSNVEKADTSLDLGCLRFQIEAGYLIHIKTDQVLQSLQEKIYSGEPLTDEEMMRMIILPLTVSETTAQQILLKKTVQLAKDISNEYQQAFALSGIVTFSDKIIDKDYAADIRRWIQMTKVGRIIEMEKEEAVKKAVQEMKEQLKTEKRKTKDAENKAKNAENKAKNAENKAKSAENKAKNAEAKAKTAELKVCILQMLLKGYTIPEAAEKFHMKPAEVARLLEE